MEYQVKRDAWLSPINQWPRNKPLSEWESFLNMHMEDYLEVLDWTGRQHRADKPGKTPGNLKKILIHMQIETDSWLKTVEHFDN